MTTALTTTPVQSSAVHSDLSARIASSAVAALTSEVQLRGKPGLVGPDGARGHADMDCDLMRLSAHTLHPTFRALADHGAQTPVGQKLRDTLGRVGRRGEAEMMTATGGVNTHRGAIWNMGLMVTATAGLQASDSRVTVGTVTRRAGEIASLSDSAFDLGQRPGAHARRRYRVGGAVSEAASGFPHVRAIAAAIRTAGDEGFTLDDARLIGLLTSMSTLDDTCILHRGGRAALEMVHDASYRMLEDTFRTGRLDRRALAGLDVRMTGRRLSPGGSADLLACALFLTTKDN